MKPEYDWLFITPLEGLEYCITPKRTIGIQLGYTEEQIGLLPGRRLALELTPAEARQIAEVLLRKADAAEAGIPRA